MAGQFTIPEIITFSKISQFLSSNDKAFSISFRSGSLIQRQPSLLYMEGELLENMYTLNPGGSTIRSTAEYVLSLCGKYLNQAQTILNNLLQNTPIVTGPSNQSVGVGVNATFSIGVTSSLSYTVQWYDSFGVAIPGATGLTYTYVNAQLTDTGKTFYAKATNAAGTTVSAIATLTVTQALLGQVYYGNTDYSTDLQAGTDNVPYIFTFPITTGQPFSIQFPVPISALYIVIKYPNTEPTKNFFNNPPVDNGVIPGFALNAAAFGGSKYVFSRNGNPFTTNPSNLITLSTV